MSQVSTPAQADFKMSLLNAKAASVPSSEIFIWLSEQGLPSEVSIRLKGLIDTTAMVAGKVIHVGKIILIKIIEFFKEHPNLVVAMALGTVVGFLVSTIPFVGPILAPIVTVIAMGAGAVAGYRIDQRNKGLDVNTNDEIIPMIQDVVEVVKHFIKLLVDIFNAVFGREEIRQV